MTTTVNQAHAVGDGASRCEHCGNVAHSYNLHQVHGTALCQDCGFTASIGKFNVSFNAGWYSIFLNWQGAWYLSVSHDPFQASWYSRWNDGGCWPKCEVAATSESTEMD